MGGVIQVRIRGLPNLQQAHGSEPGVDIPRIFEKHYTQPSVSKERAQLERIEPDSRVRLCCQTPVSDSRVRHHSLIGFLTQARGGHPAGRPQVRSLQMTKKGRAAPASGTPFVQEDLCRLPHSRPPAFEARGQQPECLHLYYFGHSIFPTLLKINLSAASGPATPLDALRVPF